jgi:hypothetical protein
MQVGDAKPPVSKRFQHCEIAGLPAGLPRTDRPAVIDRPTTLQSLASRRAASALGIQHLLAGEALCRFSISLPIVDDFMPPSWA